VLCAQNCGLEILVEDDRMVKVKPDKSNPRSKGYASAQGGHFEGAFGLSILRAMGSQYFYNSGGQEFSSSWWLFGRMLGKQYNVAVPDEHHTQMLVGWGWNGMESHQMPRAPKVLKEFSKDPERLLVIVDPRKSETAAIANIHLPVRPGTDAPLIKAMISIIVENQWENKLYIADHVEGWHVFSMDIS
jgi:anaerobic selenocysteine-containing dehydrogenase